MVLVAVMGQVTIYLDDETEQKMTANARAMNLSKSKWIAGTALAHGAVLVSRNTREFARIDNLRVENWYL